METYSDERYEFLMKMKKLPEEDRQVIEELLDILQRPKKPEATNENIAHRDNVIDFTRHKRDNNAPGDLE